MTRLKALVPAVAALVIFGACSTSGPNDGGRLPADGGERPGDLMLHALRTIYALDGYEGSRRPDTSAVEAMGESGDTSYIPVLVELLRFPWSLDEDGERAILDALARLTGSVYEDPAPEERDWLWWSEWVTQNPDVLPPEGFARWKAQLLHRMAHPTVSEFFYDGVEASIRLEEVVWGSVPRDGIPDLRYPPAIPADEATYLDLDERVFGISLTGEHRSYPLRIMNYHEMANDELGGVHFALAYCTLCGSAIAYLTEVDGEVLSFGTSGLLYRSNKLMYDRQTKSLWTHFYGVPVMGPLTDSGIQLEVVPVTLTTWGDWVAAHPETTVLSLETGTVPRLTYRHEADPASADYEYRNEPGTIFPGAPFSDILPAKEEVLGIESAGEAKAYPLSELHEEGLVNDRVGEARVVIVSTGRGSATRAYDGEDVWFTSLRIEDGVAVVTDEEGDEWRAEEGALVNVRDGRALKRLPGTFSYWFAWYSFYLHTQVYERS